MKKPKARNNNHGIPNAAQSSAGPMKKPKQDINPHSILDVAKAFVIAGDRLSEKRPIPGPGNMYERPLVPLITSLAFSIELSMKSIIAADGRSSWGHDLYPLFIDLPELVKRQVVADMDSTELAIRSQLEQANKSFEEWRYVFEFAYLNLDRGFMDQLAKVLVRCSENFLKEKGIERPI